MTHEHKNFATQTDILTRLREEIKFLDTEIMNERARIGDFKRQTTKDFLALKFGGLLQCGEVSTVSLLAWRYCLDLPIFPCTDNFLFGPTLAR